MAESVTCWIDASAGIAGDMLLGALVDAGASLDVVRGAVEAVAPGEVTITAEQVVRHGMRATKVHVRSLHGAAADGQAHQHPERADGHTHAHPEHAHSDRENDTHPHPKPVEGHHHRAWREIDSLIAGAGLPEAVSSLARRVFGTIAVAEGRAHGVDPDEVHFHEVGAWDSIADIVGCCAALHDLGVERIVVGEVAVGSGTITMAHGTMVVPGPAVVELSRGLVVQSGPVRTELATPTGVAFLSGRDQGPMPTMQVLAAGAGAGTKDFPGHANIVRVVVGREVSSSVTRVPSPADELTVLEANIDDMDPRLWPGVLDALLEAGAKDAWLTPILMKKGRPAHTLSVLTDAPEALRGLVFEQTSTLGVREYPVRRTALEREWRTVEVQGHQVRVKLGLLDGGVVNSQPEFVDVQALARALGIPEADALRLVNAQM